MKYLRPPLKAPEPLEYWRFLTKHNTKRKGQSLCSRVDNYKRFKFTLLISAADRPRHITNLFLKGEPGTVGGTMKRSALR